MTKASLGKLLDLNAKQGASRARGPVPAEVLTFNIATQMCSCQPLVSPVGQELPEVLSARVYFPSSGLYSIVWEILPGDVVYLVPPESDTSTWMGTGASGEALTDRRYSLENAIAFASIGPTTAPLAAAAYAAGALVIAGADIRLGSSAAAQLIALSNLCDANWTTLQALLTTISTQLQTLGQAGIVVPTFPPTAATKVKAE